ncbi:hypothetical protein IKG41_00130 [Candidatus Saccharibacteria bacterium]|nr:hypothetical protein [Candidatus Saccharibacteria bacterium]
MDQNQTVDNDLQKAIDDITNTTSVDPVFSDPVAAPSSVPEGDTGELGEPIGPFPEPKVAVVEPGAEPIAPLESANIPALNNLEMPDSVPMPPEPTPTIESTPEPIPTMEKQDIEPIPQSLSTNEVKKAALRDLVPLLDKINMDASQKFKIYRDIFEDLKDYTILEPAYHAAREIPDETERANALLYLVESIDKM